VGDITDFLEATAILVFALTALVREFGAKPEPSARLHLDLELGKREDSKSQSE
jgi:hypothetical protein